MKRNRVFLVIILVFLIIFIFISYELKILGFNSDLNSLNNKADSTLSLYSPNCNEGCTKIAYVKLIYENKEVLFGSPIIISNNRYYISLNDIEKITNGSVKVKQKEAIIYNKNDNVIINYESNRYSINGTERGTLRNVIKDNDLRKYISLYDFCKIFDLKTIWNHSENTIKLYKNREQIITNDQENDGRVAFIRFEDVEAGSIYLKEDNLEKFRIIGDYFYSQGVPFHIAWVPRYVNPQKKIDNDLINKNNIENADFIFTFDYLIDKGAIVGLHGYTHQSGNEESVVGTEFSSQINTDEKVIKEIIEKAILTANQLNIPITFFETPHYRGTQFQQSIFEQYFDYIYEPYIGIYNKIPVISPRNNKTLYIPTPLSYVKGDNGIINMINSIDNNDINQVASLFVHPSKEFDYIKLINASDGYHKYYYDDNSILHQIVSEFKIKGYKIISIKDYR